tara:strand:- start:2047 stop:2829 length:783 start_codon:yes stop_codon:yes gene_type:complete
MEFKPKKKLGQNFLINDKILDKIVKVGNITDKDNILEIGPGTGNLTKYLIKAKPKSIVVIEKDTDLINQLKQRFEDRIKVINEDVLRLNENFFTKKFKVFGNLPYNISTKILSNWCLNNNIRFEKLILMFQKEVADRIISKENTKNYSRITILANWKFDIKKKFDINPGNFYPAPKIQSSVLEFIPKKKIYKIKDPRNLEHLTRVLFNQRRKMIKKNILKLFTNFDKILKITNIKLTDRPQNISVKKFLDLVVEYEKNLN